MINNVAVACFTTAVIAPIDKMAWLDLLLDEATAHSN
jgi:hypothetical protein